MKYECRAIDFAGHFLLVSGSEVSVEPVELVSPWYKESGANCRLSVALHMHNMEDGNLKIVVETRNQSWVIVETLGNSLRESVFFDFIFCNSSHSIIEKEIKCKNQ